MYIEVKHINFAYEISKAILRDISFELAKGKTLSIVGASGCGKSTLLRIVAGLLTCENSFNLNGLIRINGMTPEEFRKTGELAFMFQDPTLMPNLTVEENVRLPLQILGKRDDLKVKHLIHAVGLNKFSDYLPKSLSGGMKTRVALARSFVTDPELLLLDEPFSSLDVAWKAELYNELNNLQKSMGTTVLLVTHDIDEAITLSDSKILIFGHDGSILNDLKVDGQGKLFAFIKNNIIQDRQLQENSSL